VASVPGVVWEAWGQPDAATQRIDFVSDYVETMLGYSVEEWLSTPNFWLTIVHPDDKEQAARAAAEAFASGKSSSTLEFRWVAKNGRVLWVESKSAATTDNEGRPVGLRGVTIDITERKHAEEALRESEERYRVVAETATDVIITIDDHSTILFANRAVERVFGYALPELLGNQITILMPEYLRHVHKAAVSRYIETGRKHINWESVQLNGLHKSGREIPLELSFGEFSKDGRRFFTGIARDITERKRAEERLLQSEERYRLLFERNPQPMWVFDLESLSFLEVNDAAIHHYGYSREEFLAMTIEDLQYEHAGISKHKKKDGTIIDVEIVAHELTFYGRQAQIVLAFDVTERKTLEEELRQSQKMEAVGRLAGGVAHDFNNLLTVINGYSELSLRRLQPDDALTFNLEEIKRAGSRAASLTRQLLAFSRKQVLQPKVLDLNEVISELEKMLQRLIGEDIDLRTALTPELRRVNADPGQIEQVIMNLVVNARDAMPNGGKLTIQTENVYLTEDYDRHRLAVKPGLYAMIAVSDNGSGMNDETKANIFEPFFTTKELGKGTGLGLSTVYGIVKQSMGTIWVYSEVGLGTTFKVYLPCVEGEFDDRQASQTRQVIALGSETILLVEDDEMVRGLTRTVLEQSGYKVIQAANGAEALLICEQYADPIHLLLTDVVMPGMSGRAVADRLKTLRPQMLVLYMSGYTDDAIVHHGVLNEGVNFIEKPFATAALARKVREVLDGA
jgi:two-component system cell cycle sensor histidine kinase/response regulator CckA